MNRHLLLLTGLFTLLAFSQCKQEIKRADQEVLNEPTTKYASQFDEGRDIVQATFAALSGELKHAVQEEGVEGAIRYCNIQALPITDSLSRQHDVTISRKATQYRNPLNKAEGKDKEVMAEYAATIAAGETPEPRIVHGEKLTYYQPILMQPMCTICHGDPAVIGPAYETIAELYPEDLAIGFQPGDLRGIWKVEF